jgi:hypothetical protein
MASSQSGSTVSLTLSSATTYGLLVTALVGSIILGYVLKVFPTTLSNVGIATSLTGMVAYFAHDLTTAHIPNGWPQWTTFAVVSLATAAYGALGVFTSQTLVEYGAALTWVVAFVSYLNTYVQENGSSGLTPSQVTWVTAILGVVLATLTYAENNPDASVASILVTAIMAGAQWFHLSENGGTVTATPVAKAA